MTAAEVGERMHRHRETVGALRISAPGVEEVSECAAVPEKQEWVSEMGVTKNPSSG